jgi:hypothetical protein
MYNFWCSTIFSPLADAVIKLTAALASSDRRCFAFLIVSFMFSTTVDDDTQKLMYNFWCSPENSHPTGNKNDVKRVRLGPKKILITPSANSGKNSNGSVS